MALLVSHLRVALAVKSVSVFERDAVLLPEANSMPVVITKPVPFSAIIVMALLL
jgi:hypothetical protein